MDNIRGGEGLSSYMKGDNKKEIKNFDKTEKKVVKKKKNIVRIKKNYIMLLEDLNILYEDFPTKENYDCIITLENISEEIEKIT